MLPTNFWNLYNISSKKIGALTAFLLIFFSASAQYNIKEHDQKKAAKKYSFGIHLGATQHTYRVEHSQRFLEQNNILSVEGDKSTGIDVGLIGALHPIEPLELRIIPSINFGDRNVTYGFRDAEAPSVQKLEATNFQFPIQLKYKSKPYKDMRGFVIVGGSFTSDLSSNKDERNDVTSLKLEQNNAFGELGAGFEFHFPLFTLAPELKVSQGFLNQRVQNEELDLSRVLSGLYSRVYTLSINIE